MTAPLRSGEPVTVKVALADRGYDIVIGRGLLASIGLRIKQIRPHAKAIVVYDKDVGDRYLGTVKKSLEGAGVVHSDVPVPRGEASKSFKMFEDLCEALIAARIGRDDIVVILGGGVMGDLVGFVAASVRRGVDFVQIPTTLVGQVDSAIGGKTGINSRHGKNLVGAFHQPSLVLSDTATLDSLPRRVFANGYAEVVKYGLLGDAGFFAWLEKNWQEVFAGGPAREQAIAACCRMKADIVARDERETGDRALLNLGHTFGHAVEAEAGFSDRLFHGEAVSIGMALAFEFSARRRLIEEGEAKRVVRHLAEVGLPTRLQDVVGPRPTANALMDRISQDKKVKRGALTFILVRGIGQAFVENGVDAEDVRAFLAEKLAA